MANWCSTDYMFVGATENARRLLADLEQAVCADSWLAYVRKALLLESCGMDIPCRGEVSYLDDELHEYSDGLAGVRFSTETAWCACEELMQRIADKYALHPYYYTEEPGMGIFQTNDAEGVYFSARYMVDSESKGCEYFEDFEDVASVIRKMTGIEVSQFEDVEPMLAEWNEHSFLLVHEIEIV